MAEEKRTATRTNVYEIDGIKYRVTAEFKGEFDIHRAVYECALNKVIDEMKKSA